MFRKMRRTRQQLSLKESIAILEQASSGVLAVLGDEEYPYAVPLSYSYQNGTLYFHCAKTGHKIDAIRKHPKASFCVVDQDEVVGKAYTTYYRSVIAFGTIRLLTDEAEILDAIRYLADKYHPVGTTEQRDNAISREFDALCMFAMEIEHLTGKEAIELTRQRSNENL